MVSGLLPVQRLEVAAVSLVDFRAGGGPKLAGSHFFLASTLVPEASLLRLVSLGVSDRAFLCGEPTGGSPLLIFGGTDLGLTAAFGTVFGSSLTSVLTLPVGVPLESKLGGGAAATDGGIACAGGFTSCSETGGKTSFLPYGLYSGSVSL